MTDPHPAAQRRVKILLWTAISAGTFLLTSCVNPRGSAVAQPEPLDRLQAVLWYQHAAETRALYYQAYNIACDKLASLTNQISATNKWAIVVDVDETILNNGPFEADLIRKGQDFTPEGWHDWVKQGDANALPGAVEFLKFAEASHVEIFYISDRVEGDFQPTARNLRALGFPMVDERHLLLAAKNEPSGKENRRQTIEKAGYSVLMLFGDSLPDFSNEFDQTNSLDRARAVDTAREKFGRKYIVLPNPMYGAWERVLAKDAKQAGIVERRDYLKLPLPATSGK